MTDLNVAPSARFLTAQQKLFVTAFARGLSIGAAARHAGCAVGTAKEWLELSEVQEALAVLREQMHAELGTAVTRENLTMMLFEAHRKAGTATEEIAAIKEIAKLNGIYEPERKEIVVTNITRIEQLQNLSDEELLRLARRADAATAAEAEFTEVPE